MKKFLSFISEIFEVDTSEISMDTRYGELEVWDSTMMIRLIMEVEEEYGCTIPIENVSKIMTLNDLYNYTIA